MMVYQTGPSIFTKRTLLISILPKEIAIKSTQVGIQTTTHLITQSWINQQINILENSALNEWFFRPSKNVI